MNIHKTEVDDYVRYVFPYNGTEWDREQAEKHLKSGSVYRIKAIAIYDFDTTIELVETGPMLTFNATMFENVNVESAREL